MQRAFVVAICLAGAVVPRGASAQDDVGRLSNVWGYLTPEYAFSVTRLAGGVGAEVGSRVRTYGVRIEAPTRGMLQPWASVAYLRRPVPRAGEQAGACERFALGTRLTIDHGRGDGGTTADREIGSTATAAAPTPRHPSP